MFARLIKQWSLKATPHDISHEWKSPIIKNILNIGWLVENVFQINEFGIYVASKRDALLHVAWRLILLQSMLWSIIWQQPLPKYNFWSNGVLLLQPIITFHFLGCWIVVIQINKSVQRVLMVTNYWKVAQFELKLIW